MKLSQISEVCWKLYSDGKPAANDQKLSKADITQMVKTSAANNFRQQYLSTQVVVSGRKLSFTNADPEYYFSSPLLAIKRFQLSDTDSTGMRIADMSEFDLYRLPKNSHFTNIYPVNNNCNGQQIGTITLVQNGEEKFYKGSEFANYLYASVVGRTLHIYHVPPCVQSVDVETSYDNPDIDITLDVCYDISNEVLGIIFRVSEANEEMKIKLQEMLQKLEAIK